MAKRKRSTKNKPTELTPIFEMLDRAKERAVRVTSTGQPQRYCPICKRYFPERYYESVHVPCPEPGDERNSA